MLYFPQKGGIRLERTIFHIDANNAFLSWTAVSRLQQGEELDIRTVPAIIGGDSQTRHGIVLAKSTPAKKYGIVTGEPTVSAFRKCPSLLSFPPDYSVYRQNSDAMFAILSRFSDRIEPFSIDEGFLEYTGMEYLFGPPLEAAEKIKQTIWRELGFTVNIGISSNKFLAKMAGELEKPNKVITLFPKEIPQKMWSLPVGDLFMVGKRTVPHLQSMGIYTIGQLAAYPLDLLEKELKSYGKMLHAYANGLDDTPLNPMRRSESPKTIGNSVTLTTDITDRESVQKVLLSLAERVSARLREQAFFAAEIAVSIRSSDFHTYSHQIQLSQGINCTNAVYEAALQCFDLCWKKEPVRLLGIRAGKLSDHAFQQLSLLEKSWDKESKADAALDQIRKKYGKNSVQRTSFLNAKPLPMKEEKNSK